MNQITFIKMNGLGNDFVIIDNRINEFIPKAHIIPQMTDRHKGIGADGVVIINKTNDADCFMTIYNADGSKASACGNASRCVARLILEETKKEKIIIKTESGMIEGSKTFNNLISINMGKPNFEASSIPLTKEADTLNMPSLSPEIKNSAAVLMGVPHLVCFCDNVEEIDIAKIGASLEKNPLFKYGTNVDFIKIINDKTIRMRVWERGAGITKACGTGACASFIVSFRKGFCQKQVEVLLDGGILLIELLENGSILMTGSANKVFTGELNLDEL